MLPGLDAAPLRREFKRLVMRGFPPFMRSFLSTLNQSDARSALGAQAAGSYAASGTNNDITNLTGLTTAISGTALGNKIQPITASVASSALTLTLNPTTLDFRSATLGSGSVNTRAVASAISLVISSGSTLGTVSAQQSRIAVLAIDNAGTVELAAVNVAGGADLTETGLISTTAEGGAGAADSASVIYSTAARSNVPYRVVGYVESTQATAGTWATAPSTIQGIGGNVKVGNAALSMIRLNTANGYGSTNTKIRRFTTTVTSQGSDITYADSAANGGSFTINTSGVYAISYQENLSAADVLGISLNSSQLTTSIATITAADVLQMTTQWTANVPDSTSWTGYLAAGSVIRAHTSGAAAGSGPVAQFTITRLS